MNIEEAALLSLIKKSQFGVEDTINWSDVDMNALYNEAFDQSVLSIVANEIPSVTLVYSKLPLAKNVPILSLFWQHF